MSNVEEIIAQANKTLAAEQANLKQWEKEMLDNKDKINAILESKPLETGNESMIAALFLRVPHYNSVPGSQGRHVDSTQKHFGGRADEIFSEKETEFLKQFGLLYSSCGRMKF